MAHDPYSVLGLSRNAGPAEWKRAFRRLAMRWHPDRSDHPEATERFKKIRAAYDQLLADEAPAEALDEADRASAHAAPPDEAAADERLPKAPDIRLNFEIELAEAAAGCRKALRYVRGKPCPTCDGSGEAGLARTRFCGACHGSGRLHDGKRGLVPCTDCGGRGLFTERICPDCGGSGRETAEVSLEIRVPPGMLSGDELRLAGQGEPGDDGRRAGDLYLTLILRAHRLFELRGRDLHCRMPVSALGLLAGAEIELPSLAGPLRHALAPGDAAPRTVRLAGLGYPGRGKLPAGDLVIDLIPVFPTRLTPRQRKLLLQANAALLDDAGESLPDIEAWRQAHGFAPGAADKD